MYIIWDIFIVFHGSVARVGHMPSVIAHPASHRDHPATLRELFPSPSPAPAPPAHLALDGRVCVFHPAPDLVVDGRLQDGHRLPRRPGLHLGPLCDGQQSLLEVHLRQRQKRARQRTSGTRRRGGAGGGAPTCQRGRAHTRGSACATHFMQPAPARCASVRPRLARAPKAVPRPPLALEASLKRQCPSAISPCSVHMYDDLSAALLCTYVYTPRQRGQLALPRVHLRPSSKSRALFVVS